MWSYPQFVACMSAPERDIWLFTVVAMVLAQDFKVGQFYWDLAWGTTINEQDRVNAFMRTHYLKYEEIEDDEGVGFWVVATSQAVWLTNAAYSQQVSNLLPLPCPICMGQPCPK